LKGSIKKAANQTELLLDLYLKIPTGTKPPRWRFASSKRTRKILANAEVVESLVQSGNGDKLGHPG